MCLSSRLYMGTCVCLGLCVSLYTCICELCTLYITVQCVSVYVLVTMGMWVVCACMHRCDCICGCVCCNMLCVLFVSMRAWAGPGHTCCMAEIRKEVRTPWPEVAAVAGKRGFVCLPETDFALGRCSNSCDSLIRGVQGNPVVGRLSGIAGFRVICSLCSDY